MSGPGPGSGGPLYFAWVDKTETTFSTGTHCRYDEPVYSWTLTHDEGQIPTLEVEIENPCVGTPYIGLLAASRKQWAWVSIWDYDTASVKPLIFGRIVGIPSDLSQRFIKVMFISRADDYITRKQTLADSLRVFPYYDPIFLDDKSRADPDAVLEGYPCRFHIDRTTLAWTISNILTGEDGTIAIGHDEILSDLSFEVKDAPLRALRATASVNWKQTFRGVTIPVVSGITLPSLTGGSLISAWPKIGTDIGGGWRAASGTYAIDNAGVADVQAYTESGSWQDTNAKHAEGDAISASWSATIPPGSIFNMKVTHTYGNTGNLGGDTGQGFGSGIISGASQAGGGGGSGSSSGVSATWQTYLTWSVSMGLVIESTGGSNKITENISFTMTADAQPVLTDGSALDSTEVVEFSSIDVGEPYADVRAWSALKGSGGSITIGQIMEPNIPVGPGGLAFQIAISSGTMGASAPLFSDVPGDTTTDGTVTWASLGGSLQSILDWQPQVYMRLGTVICLEERGGLFYLCTTAGSTGAAEPGSWNSSFGATTGDGSVVWTSLGTGGPSLIVPIGAQPGNISASDYFPSARGNQSIQAMIQRCAARMLERSRAVEIGCEIPFAVGLNLSLRKSATITHKYLPGGVATGKIISYSISADGEGARTASIKIGCAVGRGGTVASNDGVDDYSDAIAHEAQTQTGVLVALPNVSYVPPLPDPTYAGLKGPISRDEIVLSMGFGGSVASQIAAISSGSGMLGGGSYGGLIGIPSSVSARSSQAVGPRKVPGISFDLTLRPISGSEVTTSYGVSVSSLVIPKQIDLEAEPL